MPPSLTRRYGEYRTLNAKMATFNRGYGALLNLHEAIKASLDPNSIMAPGNFGIWGKKHRGRGL